MSFYSIAPFIRQHYPQYYSIERYPAHQCVCIRKVADPWGILGNFARTPLVVGGVPYNSSEHLYQVMKFTHPDAISAVYHARNPKMTAKHWEKTHRRADWGSILVDVMKHCLTVKHQQSQAFRDALQQTAGLYIVEDQTAFRKKTPDTWGVKLVGDHYVGPNLLGRLLMQLRDHGHLDYRLPADCKDSPSRDAACQTIH